MRELSEQELEQVSGGVLPLAVLGGAAISGTVSYANGDSWQGITGSAILGGLGGATSAMAKVTTGIIRAKFTGQAGALSIASGTISGSGPGTDDVADHEKVLEK
jgi:lactobin A/cerein 7B family class IIb bacteriocin